MTLEFESPANNGTGAILRALASLMAALGNDDDGARPAMRDYAPAYPPVQAPRQSAPRSEQPREPRLDPSRPTSRGRAASTEAELLLDDARQRAERILQESMERANDLLARERPTSSGGSGQPLGTSEDVESLQRSVDELLLGMRDVQARLARLESMIATATSAPMAAPPSVAPAPTPMTPTSPATPTAPRAAYPPIEEERRPGVLSVVAPQSPQPVRADVPPPPGAPPPPPAALVLPPSAVPPVRGGVQPAAMQQPAFVEDDEPEVAGPAAAAPAAHREDAPATGRAEAPASSPWERRRDDADDDAPGTLATFTPADGTVLLRAAPVSGFQGLMRLQDALQRIPAIRQATVEAYSQGEARLRLELAEDVDADEIAEGVGAGLGQNAQVREASEEDRTIVIACE